MMTPENQNTNLTGGKPGAKDSQESEYDRQAREFLESTGTEFKAEFLKYDKYFPGDKESRDIYQIILTRGNRSYSFTFGQSIVASGKYITYPGHKPSHTKKGTKYGDWKHNPEYATPSPYDVLAALTKYDVGSFETFCSEFGYDTDSRTAEKIYKAVCDEYLNLERLFSTAEIEQMQEIQ